MRKVNLNELRDFIECHYGTAIFNGFPVALLDLSDIGSMDEHELLQIAEEMGVDLRRFEIDEDENDPNCKGV